MIVVLRACGRDLDIDACSTWLASERLEATWRAGEVQGGKTLQDSGFNLLLAEAEHAELALPAAKQELEVIKESVMLLASSGVALSVDVSLEVFSSQPRSIVLPPEFMRVVIDSGAKLVISAHPCSDDDD